jgi:hypothetical protein
MSGSNGYSIQPGCDKGSVLEDLPPSVRRYLYQGKENFHQILHLEFNRLQNVVRDLRDTLGYVPDITEYIAFSIDDFTFERDFLDLSTRRILSIRSSSDPTTDMLVIKMVTPEHHEAVRAFENESDNLLEGLPLSVRKYLYQGEKNFHQIKALESTRLHNLMHDLQSTPGDVPDITEYIVFSIDALTFEGDFLDPNTGPPTKTFTFNPTTNILLIKMVTAEHTKACAAFRSEIQTALVRMRLDRAVDIYAHMDVVVGENDQKKLPDEGWGPKRPPRGYPRRPTVVLEVAVSETQAKLRQDAEMWVDPARGKANIAIAVKVKRRQQFITFDKWEWDSTSGQSENTTHIVVAKSAAGDDFTVSESPLTIPFHLLFRRPASSPSEADIEIGEQALKDIATEVWDTEGL